MSDDIKRFESKIDKIDESISRIDITLAAQHESLKDHIRRTEILEQAIKPVQAHVNMTNGVIKFLAILSGLAVLTETLLQIFKK